MLVHNFLENSAARLPQKVALICGDQRLTYREINDKADQVAYALINMGVKRQDRVVIFLDNSAESVISLFGVLKVGAIFIMLNPTMKAKKLCYILKDSGACTIITSKSKFSVIEDAASDTPDLKNIVWIVKPPRQMTADLSQNHHPWEDFFFSPVASSETNSWPPSVPASQLPSLPASQPPGFPAPCIDLDLACIIYTSGSTGEPKGVMSAHYNMVAAARSIIQYLENREDDIILDTLPLSFDYGLYQVLMAFLFGGTVVLGTSFAFPYKTMELLVREKVTGFPIVPTMAAMLLQMESLSKFDFSSLRYMTNTAAALPVAYIRKLQALFHHVKIFSMYGLTECKRVSYLPPDMLAKRPESVGIPIPNEEVFVVDEQGKERSPGEVGELVVRGTNVMQGYWKAEEETACTFRPGRYRGETLLYTGDLFKRDEEGFLYFVGRKDDMIKTKGERVSPREIENVLSDMEDVAEAAVIGVPDEIFGQAVKAFIVKTEGSRMTQETVLKHCHKNLEPFAVPKFIEFTDSFPKSPTGKIDKKQLK